MNLSESFAVSEACFVDEEEEDLAPVDLPENRDKWKNDLKCNVCNKNFNSGVAHSQRAVCCFCYRGTCSTCLVFTFKHPETFKKEKMCKTCRWERHQISLILPKVNEYKLEKIQMNLEVEIAVHERQEFASQRKKIQENLTAFKSPFESSLNQQEILLNQLKKEHELLARKKEVICSDVYELDEIAESIHLRLKNAQEATVKAKKDLQDKEKLEKLLKEETNSVKLQQIALLQQFKSKERESCMVSGRLSELRREIDELVVKISEIFSESQELESVLTEAESRHDKNSSVLFELENKISFKKSTFYNPDELTDEERVKMKNQVDILKKYDEVIRHLEERLILIKQRHNRSIRSVYSRIDRMSAQNEIIANKHYMQKNGLVVNPKPSKNKSSSTSCSNCSIS
jgi:chromosome segregation ATPase